MKNIITRRIKPKKMEELFMYEDYPDAEEVLTDIIQSLDMDIEYLKTERDLWKSSPLKSIKIKIRQFSIKSQILKIKEIRELLQSVICNLQIIEARELSAQGNYEEISF